MTNGTRRTCARGFTLVELLVVILILGILASIASLAYFDAMQEARVSRTRAQIKKIDELLAIKLEAYRSRPVPVRTSGFSPEFAARQRLLAIRELMRMELPDRITDVTDDPAILSAVPSATSTYRRRVAQAGSWSPQNQQAECLYMIVASVQDGTRSGLDFFRDNEIGDVDDDGMREIIDAWGQPIRFLRWAPGYVSTPAVHVSDLQHSGDLQPDPYDPLKLDPRWKNNSQDDRHYPYTGPAFGQTTLDDPFQLFPLVFSAGPDGLYHIIVDEYSTPATPPLADDYDSGGAGTFNGAGPLHYRDTHGPNYAQYTWNAPWPDPPWPTNAAGGPLWSGPPRNDPYVIPYDAPNSASCDLRIGARFPDPYAGAEDNIDNHTLAP